MLSRRLLEKKISEEHQLAISEATQARSKVESAETKGTQGEQEVRKAKSAAKTAEEQVPQEESRSPRALPQESQEDLTAKSEKTPKAKDAKLQEGSKAQASVPTAGDTGIALMAQDVAQPSPHPVAMALVMFSGMAIMSRRRSLPSFPDALSGLLPITEP
jgi:hypothetical protein